MTASNNTRSRPRFGGPPRVVSFWLLHLLALSILAATLIATVLIWPFSYLGYDVAVDTIAYIAPRSPAADAGLQRGDRIITLYGHPWHEVIAQWSILPLIGPRTQPVEMTVERAGQRRTVSIERPPPSQAFQVAKVIPLILAGLCWLTGYLLGVVRRQHVAGSPIVGVFWLGLSGVLGTYTFAKYASVPLQAALYWLILLILVPLAMYIHVWFPPRPVSPKTARLSRWVLLGTILAGNLVFVGALMLWRPTALAVIYALGGLVPAGLCLSCVVNGVQLFRAYRRVTIGHVRRQIRVIATACFIMAAAWTLLLVLPEAAGREPLISDRWIDVIAGLVPLAYLVSGVVPNLYHVDRALLRFSALIAAATGLAILFAIVDSWLQLGRTELVLWMALGAVVLFPPAYRLALRIFPAHRQLERSYQALTQAEALLPTTLESDKLVAILHEGVRRAFHEPAFAFFERDPSDLEALHCVDQQTLTQLPATIPFGSVTAALEERTAVVLAPELYHTVATQTLQEAEQGVLLSPDIALWCPILHAQGYLLGLMLIGPDRNLDPYEANDLRELQRLVDAASFAWMNSASYRERCDAEEQARQLYHKLQEAYDETATTIAREIHDEVINVGVRENIDVLQRMIEQTAEPAIRNELKEILQNEQSLRDLLRLVCEQLHPTGTDDPLGLAGVLRTNIESLAASWPGACTLWVEGSELQIAALQQREAVRIAREAVANAIKHANATMISTVLVYPASPDGDVEMRIEDDGQHAQPIVSKFGHWGVLHMRESARMADGVLTFRAREGGGTVVVFTFPAASEAVNANQEPSEAV